MAIIKDFIKYRRFLLEGNAVLFTWARYFIYKTASIYKFWPVRRFHLTFLNPDKVPLSRSNSDIIINHHPG